MSLKMKEEIIPASALNQHIVAIGKSGSGKTFAIKAVVVEPLLAAGKHVCAIDPTSAWWGLRSSADGKGPGFEVLIVGGDHGDLPVPVHGGAALARLLIEQHVNMVVDTGLMTVGERTRWMADFGRELYRLNRAPLHLVIDEAHLFAPQGKIMDPEAGKMLHAVSQIASGGRSRGIRLTMITQRPQKLHKDVLTTADTLIAMRVLAPQDRGAVKDWIDGMGDPTAGKEVLDSLASLKNGEGWVWYPEGGILHRVKFPPIKTFDSSATPKEGKAIQAPKGAAQIDLSAIREALAEAVKEAEDNDPKALRARVTTLERELSAKIGKTDQPAINGFDVTLARQEGYHAGQIAMFGQVAPILNMLDTVGKVAGDVADDLKTIRSKLGALHGQVSPQTAPTPPTGAHRQSLTIPTPKAPTAKPAPSRPASGQNSPLPPGERAVLISAIQFPAVRRDELTVLTGYKRSSRDAYIARLVQKGMVVARGEGVIEATPEGVAALGAFDPLPTGAALREYWMGRLPAGEARILALLADNYPKWVDRSTLDIVTGFKRSSRDAYLSRMKPKRLIEDSGRGQVRASPTLF